MNSLFDGRYAAALRAPGTGRIHIGQVRIAVIDLDDPQYHFQLFLDESARLTTQTLTSGAPTYSHPGVMSQTFQPFSSISPTLYCCAAVPAGVMVTLAVPPPEP